METKQVQTNTFTGGLNMDLHPMLVPDTMLTDCVNGTIITYNGNEYLLQNDQGNVSLENSYLPVDYVPVGFTEYNGIIYIVSHNPITGKSQIGTYPSPEYQKVNKQSFSECNDILINSVKVSSINELSKFVFDDYNTENKTYSYDSYIKNVEIHSLTDETEDFEISVGDKINLSGIEPLEEPFQRRLYFLNKDGNNNYVELNENNEFVSTYNGYLKLKNELIKSKYINFDIKISHKPQFGGRGSKDSDFRNVFVNIFGDLLFKINSDFKLNFKHDIDEEFILCVKLDQNITYKAPDNTEQSLDYYEYEYLNYNNSDDIYSFYNTVGISIKSAYELLKENIDGNKINWAKESEIKSIINNGVKEEYKVSIIPAIYKKINDEYKLMYFDSMFKSTSFIKDWEYNELSDNQYQPLNYFKYYFTKSENNVSVNICCDITSENNKAYLYQLTTSLNDNGEYVPEILENGSHIQLELNNKDNNIEGTYKYTATNQNITNIGFSPGVVNGWTGVTSFGKLNSINNLNSSDNKLSLLFRPWETKQSVFDGISLFRIIDPNGKVIVSEIVYPFYSDNYLKFSDENSDGNSNYNHLSWQMLIKEYLQLIDPGLENINCNTDAYFSKTLDLHYSKDNINFSKINNGYDYKFCIGLLDSPLYINHNFELQLYHNGLNVNNEKYKWLSPQDSIVDYNQSYQLIYNDKKIEGNTINVKKYLIEDTPILIPNHLVERGIISKSDAEIINNFSRKINNYNKLNKIIIDNIKKHKNKIGALCSYGKYDLSKKEFNADTEDKDIYWPDFINEIYKLTGGSSLFYMFENFLRNGQSWATWNTNSTDANAKYSSAIKHPRFSRRENDFDETWSSYFYFCNLGIRGDNEIILLNFIRNTFKDYTNFDFDKSDIDILLYILLNVYYYKKAILDNNESNQYYTLNTNNYTVSDNSYYENYIYRQIGGITISDSSILYTIYNKQNGGMEIKSKCIFNIDGFNHLKEDVSKSIEFLTFPLDANYSINHNLDINNINYTWIQNFTKKLIIHNNDLIYSNDGLDVVKKASSKAFQKQLKYYYLFDLNNNNKIEFKEFSGIPMDMIAEIHPDVEDWVWIPFEEFDMCHIDIIDNIPDSLNIELTEEQKFLFTHDKLYED